MTRQLLFPAAAFVVALAAAAAPAAGQALFGVPPFAPDAPPGATPDPWTSQRFSATVDAALLGAAGPREIALDMFGRRVVAVKDRSETDASTGAVSYFGTVAGEPMSSVVFVAEQDGRVAGTVRTMNKSYAVLPQDSSIHSVAELDVRAFPAEAHPLVPQEDLPPVPARFWTGRRLSARQVATIDVLVVYTPQARAAVGGTANMEARIRLAVAETNQAYANSRINMVMRLAHAAEIGYGSGGDMYQDLDRLTATSDGFMDEVHILRDNYGADVVSLWVSVGSYCGLGWLMGAPSLGFASYAFNVVHYSCATGYFSFGHEVGHNMGANHDRANSGGGQSYPYSYGYQEPTGLWRTIMAYDCPKGCARLQYFSNPAVTYNGRAMGIDSTQANGADNARTFNNHAQIMAAWRAEVTNPRTFTTWTAKTTTSRTRTSSTSRTLTTSTTRTASTTLTTTSRTTTTLSPNAFTRCGGSFPIEDLLSTNSSLISDIPTSLTRLAVRIDMQHTYLSDIEITLVRESDGLSAVLYQFAGCEFTAYEGASFSFDDGEPALLGDACDGGGFRPAEGFARFLGGPAGGKWTLSVLDGWQGETGQVYGWCIEGEAAPASSTATATTEARASTTGTASTTRTTTSRSTSRTETTSRTRTTSTSRTRTTTTSKTRTTTTSNTRTTTTSKTRTTTDTKTRTSTTTKTATSSTTRVARTTSAPAQDGSRRTTSRPAALPAKSTTRGPAGDAVRRPTTRRGRKATTRRRTTTRKARGRVGAFQWG
ncbi:Metallo-peptidase family M12B Reprolysin-like-domain-containing protein [Hyaloraphidium curvatum]|nr:Metallo-peptidase family M12B Reprolysin-like-domain-containing protein [Hyaloraphidium curvatum]